jgi:hypothetical protein
MPLVLMLLLCLAQPNAGSPVSFEPGKDQLVIQIDGKPFATYVWDDPSIKRPYFAHVRSPRGVPVTRNLPPVEGKDATDHATMHPGLWLEKGETLVLRLGVLIHDGDVDRQAAYRDYLKSMTEQSPNHIRRRSRSVIRSSCCSR